MQNKGITLSIYSGKIEGKFFGGSHTQKNDSHPLSSRSGSTTGHGKFTHCKGRYCCDKERRLRYFLKSISFVFIASSSRYYLKLCDTESLCLNQKIIDARCVVDVDMAQPPCELYNPLINVTLHYCE